jgi:hypothetical protein
VENCFQGLTFLAIDEHPFGILPRHLYPKPRLKTFLSLKGTVAGRRAAKRLLHCPRRNTTNDRHKEETEK